MAETIGITASILQIAQGVVVGVNLAKDIDRAPEELRSLQVSREVQIILWTICYL